MEFDGRLVDAVYDLLYGITRYFKIAPDDQDKAPRLFSNIGALQELLVGFQGMHSEGRCECRDRPLVRIGVANRCYDLRRQIETRELGPFTPALLVLLVAVEEHVNAHSGDAIRAYLDAHGHFGDDGGDDPPHRSRRGLRLVPPIE